MHNNNISKKKKLGRTVKSERNDGSSNPEGSQEGPDGTQRGQPSLWSCRRTLGPIVSLGKGKMEGKEEGGVERPVVYLR